MHILSHAQACVLNLDSQLLSDNEIMFKEFYILCVHAYPWLTFAPP